MRHFFLAFLLALSFGAPLRAQEAKLGAIEMTGAYARATPPSARSGAGYMTLRNSGKIADRLVSVSSTFAPRVEIHEMSMAGDVMTMRPLKDGIALAPGASVELKPGGMHLMFLDLSMPLRDGDAVELKLQFEGSGTVTLRMPVKAIAAGAHAHH